jgi:glutathione synthase/RimK-type ligase-like ATP-grasp enzyme
MRFILAPYKMGSASARLIRDRLRSLGHTALCVRPDGRYRYRQGDLILNWGSSRTPEWMTNEAVLHTLNKPHNVASASNKLQCFQTLFSSEIPTVPFTTDIALAQDWARNGTVYVRHVLNGHSGDGIEIVTGGDSEVDGDIRELTEIADRLFALDYTALGESVEYTISTLESEQVDAIVPLAPLYTKKIENTGEYRVHVFKGEVIDYRKKSRHDGDEATDEQGAIRNLANGWIYRSGNLNRLERVESLAISAVEALGLDFGAVDIIKDENGDVMVLEVNTAVGLEEQTLQNYVNAILLCQVQ